MRKEGKPFSSSSYFFFFLESWLSLLRHDCGLIRVAFSAQRQHCNSSYTVKSLGVQLEMQSKLKWLTFKALLGNRNACQWELTFSTVKYIMSLILMQKYLPGTSLMGHHNVNIKDLHLHPQNLSNSLFKHEWVFFWIHLTSTRIKRFPLDEFYNCWKLFKLWRCDSNVYLQGKIYTFVCIFAKKKKHNVLHSSFNRTDQKKI